MDIQFTNKCFKCALDQCVKCNGIESKKARILSMVEARQRIIALGKLERIDLDRGLARIKHLDYKIALMQS